MNNPLIAEMKNSNWGQARIGYAPKYNSSLLLNKTARVSDANKMVNEQYKITRSLSNLMK